MSSGPDQRVLDATEAARIIFNTTEPTPEQVLKVRGEIRRGKLKRSPQGGWTTTAEAVADFFAARATANLVAHVEGADSSTDKPAKPASAAEESNVTDVYQTLLKDYFLGVFLQRQSRQYPDLFQRAVLAGQVLMVLGLLAIVLWVAFDATGAFQLGKTPQQLAVERWIEEKHGPFEIVSVAPGAAATDLTVKYRYRAPSGKQIETQRVFRVVGESVSLVVDE